MTVLKTGSGLIVTTDELDDLGLPDWWDDRAVKRGLERGYGYAPFEVYVHERTGRRFRNRAAQLTIIVTLARWDHADAWLHASISHPNAMPSYDELKVMHRAVFGDRHAYQVFAPERKHINGHPFCLHLWGRLDGDGDLVLPDFGRWGVI